MYVVCKFKDVYILIEIHVCSTATEIMLKVKM